MRRFTKGSLVTLGALALAVPAAAQFGGPPPPPNTGVPLNAKMMGGDGYGQFTGVIDPPKGTFCYMVNVWNLENITAAHVHVGGPGENGGPVITLASPADGNNGGCVPITAEVANAVLANPQGYYVNVHTRQFPAGAIRGQLMR